MQDKASERAAMPKGTSVILDDRSLEHSYATLIPLLKPGMHVLDVGCGTGAITAGIADFVGPEGSATGIDSSEHLIAKGLEDQQGTANLELITADLYTWQPNRKFDLIVSARVLQWLNDPLAALVRFRELLQPGGHVSILDYNHTKLEWQPAPPASMRRFYQAFLQWRADAGMDNEIAEHLPTLFEKAGYRNIQSFNADETYSRAQAGFTNKAAIWSKVAELRGPQVVDHGFITEAERLQAIEEYDAWTLSTAQSMIMKLNDVHASL
ncbi:methyltransferase domain-containing protein [Chitinophaga qingshengii]|uniref:Class I SAM-dependent methyltransferase n=1 Tax=Chitinophaga qingshengii TaxID=1569794 RepID=A0ABR7TRE0_9BACT|nr:methyltransferase domain-containing protein [Chitinophaga qingshengii]MBC9933064.1 class I SAM-dependent methyltransferase [Chitinophaga qingshengii]